MSFYRKYPPYYNFKRTAHAPVARDYASPAAVAETVAKIKRVYTELMPSAQQTVNSLLDYNAARGQITVRQEALLNAFVKMVEANKARVTIQFHHIRDAMDAARTNGNLKQPRMSFRFDRGALSLVYVERSAVTGQRSAHINVFQNNRHAGVIDAAGNGSFKPHITPDNVDFLRELDGDFFGVAAREGKRMGACCFCSRTLTDPASLDQGYGPICARHYHRQIAFNAATAPSQIGRI